MQAALRDRYQRLGVALQCTVLSGAVLALAFAFAAGKPAVTVLGVTAERATWLGWLAVGTFVLSLIELVLDLRGKAKERDTAVRSLSALKAEYRGADLTDPSQAARLAARYAAVTDAVPAIPERQFVRLKAAHLRKIELSKIVSCRPGMRVVRARWALFMRHNRGS